jgi:hypothetical protein
MPAKDESKGEIKQRKLMRQRVMMRTEAEKHLGEELDQ